MRKHATDVTALVFGLLFTAIAVGFLFRHELGVAIPFHLVVPGLLIGLGVVGLVGAVAAGRRGSRETTEEGTDAESPTPATGSEVADRSEQRD